jgi:hypothetical protein
VHHPFTLASVKKGSLKLEGTGRVFPMQLLPVFASAEEAHQCMGFHFSMWLEANPDVTDYRLALDMEVCDSPITVHRQAPVWIFFGKLKDKNAFQRWIARYREWFGGNDIDRAYFPVLPISGRHTLTFLTIPSGMKLDPRMMDMTFPDGSVERWAWVLSNCRNPVYVTPNGLAFTSAKEALHFKLRWSEAQNV